RWARGPRPIGRWAAPPARWPGPPIPGRVRLPARQPLRAAVWRVQCPSGSFQGSLYALPGGTGLVGCFDAEDPEVRIDGGGLDVIVVAQRVVVDLAHPLRHHEVQPLVEPEPRGQTHVEIPRAKMEVGAMDPSRLRLDPQE